MTTQRKSRSRAEAERLAWSLWERIGAGRVEEAFELLDDGGTWWPLSIRTEQPMAHMKKVLREIYQIVPMTFDCIGTIVEGNRVAVMAESHADLPDGGKYNNVYTFIMTLHPERDVITGIREYADTHHASMTLIPAVTAAMKRRGGGSALSQVMAERQASLPS